MVFTNKWTQDRIVKWHKETFPDATKESQLLKLEEEIREVLEARRKNDLALLYEELSDVYIVCVTLDKRYDSYIGKFFLLVFDELGIDVSRGAEEKMKVNCSRNWVKNEKGTYRHADK